MKNRKQTQASLGELIASVYEEASQITDDVNLATRLTATEIGRWLIRTGRRDLARRLALDIA